MILFLFSLLVVSITSQCGHPTLNFNKPIAKINTIPTLQVVAMPLLNPDVSPLADKIFDLLAKIDTELIRYVPWFPYPKTAVAELEPPDLSGTSWDFSSIEPQFRRFMNATYNQGRSVIINFSTQPTWMYNTTDWSYPVDPNKMDLDYVKGTLFPNTTQLLVDYYTRFMSWIQLGSFKDELGIIHYNTGQTYKITHWEIFNEPQGCHGLDPAGYTYQYDEIVKSVRKNVDPDIKFVGLALYDADPVWVTYFLNPNNHDPEALPIDYISFHNYAVCTNRTDANTYEQFFGQADSFFEACQLVMDIKKALSPHTKLDIDELGVLLPDDNNFNYIPFPLVYWNAAAAFYAYIYGNLAPMGYDAIGVSQLVGVPVMMEYDIFDANNPGVSMMNWTTGDGTARYWGLRLLTETFQPGDVFVGNDDYHQVFCGDLFAGQGSIQLNCADSSDVINSIQFAAFGTPTGTCGNYIRGTCDASNATQYVRTSCIGQNNCSVQVDFGDPCPGTYKRFVVQATCTGTKGGKGVPTNSPVFVQGVIDAKSSKKKILVVNKKNSAQCTTIDGIMGGMAYILDESSGFGPARQTTLISDTITLEPFGFAVIFLKA